MTERNHRRERASSNGSALAAFYGSVSKSKPQRMEAPLDDAPSVPPPGRRLYSRNDSTMKDDSDPRGLDLLLRGSSHLTDKSFLPPNRLFSVASIATTWSSWRSEDDEFPPWHSYLHPIHLFLLDAIHSEDGDKLILNDEDRSWRYWISSTLRSLIYDPLSPEFNSVQRICWAVLIGAMMGVYVSLWKQLIEGGITILWEQIPAYLYAVFGGSIIIHWVWIIPSLAGAALSYAFAKIKLPDQNAWITAVHTRGVLDSTGLVTLFTLTTIAMWSGLSLGPELPLVLTAGMMGSWMALKLQQSMLQARILNLTAASAAVGGFFGFPMAGALFVLEIPHRMGLEYFEALSPATIASIIAVLVNRWWTGNSVTGYFEYPFLAPELPSAVYGSAVVYGLFGAGVGTLYAMGALRLKVWVHDWFHAKPVNTPDGDDARHEAMMDGTVVNEQAPLLPSQKSKKRVPSVPQRPLARSFSESISELGCCAFRNEPIRAAAAGALAGAVVGIIGLVVPHTFFWGEAQLQTLIDKGRTPLPVFNMDEEWSAALSQYSFCLIDPNDSVAVLNGFSLECSLLITVSKVVVVGLSLGTGIIGGHFWGPLFIGCSASHFFTGIVDVISKASGGFGKELAAFPCVAILCTMASAHVVTFRAHMAIMLILTLTISAFNPKDNSDFSVAGDYSAVFPLLVVSVFVSLMFSRGFVFYKSQCSRGDITPVPEVLCQPGMEGRPMVVDYENLSGDGASNDDCNEPGYESSEPEPTPESIELQFAEKVTDMSENRQKAGAEQDNDVFDDEKLSSDRLDELLGVLKTPVGKCTPLASTKPSHRRTSSAPVVPRPGTPQSSASSVSGNRDRSNSASKPILIRVPSYGHLHTQQPSLLDQAETRSASSSQESKHRRVASMSEATHRHRRTGSWVMELAPKKKHSRHPSLPQPPKRPPSRRAAKATTPRGSSTATSSSSFSSRGVFSFDSNDTAEQILSNDAFLQNIQNSFD